jgi:hypothetical protein
VKNHLRSAFDKLGVWSRLELALYVASHGGAKWEGSVLTIESAVEVAVGAAARAAEAAAKRGAPGF